MTRVDLCVCTFQRPELAGALASLARQDWPKGHAGRIIVIDNDDTPSAEALVARFAETAPLPVLYLHRPGRNIALARNAALEASDADLLAFLDDDEVAAPDWIGQLIAALPGHDAVLGPVRAVYAPNAPAWMQAGGVHDTRPVWVRGEILTGYTCNVLIDRLSPHVAGLRFDVSLGRSGGEDSQFFTALHRRGGRIAFAPEAWVSEAVPEDRARLGWLLKRRWRMGLTHARGLGRGKAALALGKAAICGAGAVLTALWPLKRNMYLMRATLHLGVVWGALGGAAPVLYGQSTRAKPHDA